MHKDIIRVLVVDDSPFMRILIRDMLETDRNIKVVAVAKNGKDALQKINNTQPDIITLDVEMPIMDGLECLQHIIKHNPLPVIMLSSFTKEGAEITLKALELGALDFVTKPGNFFRKDTFDFKTELINKVKLLAGKRVGRPHQPETQSFKNINMGSKKLSTVVAIGTSTGGPKALKEILTQIPEDIPAAFVIVQHMPPGFTRSLAERMNSLSKIKVKEGEEGDELKKGIAFIAPGGYHITVENAGDRYVLHLNKGPLRNGHRPSVDVMMESFENIKDKKLIGIILTGMGSDGAEGIRTIKQQKGVVIAQSEETCVVYGMPKAAVETGLVDWVLPLEDISKKIISLVLRE